MIVKRIRMYSLEPGDGKRVLYWYEARSVDNPRSRGLGSTPATAKIEARKNTGRRRERFIQTKAERALQQRLAQTYARTAARDLSPTTIRKMKELLNQRKKDDYVLS